MERFNFFKKMVLILIFSTILLSSYVLSQLTLQPGNTNIFIQPIVIYPPSIAGGDYGGNSLYPSTLLTPQQPLGLRGNISYLVVKWDARWYDNSPKDIGVRCYLNCPNPDEDIDANCASYQKCEYLGAPGRHSCVIQNPNYLFKDLNNITCKFYNPESPEVDFLPYPQRSFWIVDYQAKVVSELNPPLGEAYNLLINIKNLGLIPTSFYVNFTDIQNPLNPTPVVLENNLVVTEKMNYGETTLALPRMLVLSSGRLTFQTDVKSNLEPAQSFSTACNLDSDCPSSLDLNDGVYCLQNRCWQRSLTQATIGVKSLSEFGLIEVIEIILIATFLFFLKLKNIEKKRY
jgi:hypothetical protein